MPSVGIHALKCSQAPKMGRRGNCACGRWSTASGSAYGRDEQIEELWLYEHLLPEMNEEINGLQRRIESLEGPNDGGWVDEDAQGRLR